jgi:hypothetical protein
MGFASMFHSYADKHVEQRGGLAVIVGPGDDTEDIEFWEKRGHPVHVVGRGGDDTQTRMYFDKMLCKYYAEGAVLVSGARVVWATHVLEHALDVHSFLTQCRNLLEPGGHLFVSVPPLKHDIVGGHVNLFNMGLLMYRLILAGFDVANGAFKERGYNLFAHVRKPLRPIRLPDLAYDCGDIERMAEAGLWPNAVKAKQDFDGRISSCNWGE